MRLRHSDSAIHHERTGRRHAGACSALLAAAAFTAAPILAEGVLSPVLAQATAQKAAKAAYDPKTDPFAQNDRIAAISSSLEGNPIEKIAALFTRLRVGGSEGVKTAKADGRAPRTASEALAKGGDCTDLACLAVSVLRGQGIPGGAMVVHFTGSPKDVDHMVAYAEVDRGHRIILDLQADKLNKTRRGDYTIVITYPGYGQAAAMYHREYGDYLRDSGRPGEATAAYERSAEIYGSDAYVHQNLGILYEKAGDMARAAERFKTAAALDPGRARTKDVTRGTYNEELQAGQKDYEGGDFCGCAQHFENALESGEKLTKQERATIGQYRDACISECK